MDKEAEIILKSKFNNNVYYMFNDMIIVENGKDVLCIELPRMSKGICFYDMYYSNECIYVIVATRGNYDIRYILQEETLMLVSQQLSK